METEIGKLIIRLDKLHAEYGIIWTLGSGESHKKKFGGIAALKDSNRALDVRNWLFSDDPWEVLQLMVNMIETELKL